MQPPCQSAPDLVKGRRVTTNSTEMKGNRGIVARHRHYVPQHSIRSHSHNHSRSFSWWWLAHDLSDNRFTLRLPGPGECTPVGVTGRWLRVLWYAWKYPSCLQLWLPCAGNIKCSSIWKEWPCSKKLARRSYIGSRSPKTARHTEKSFV